MAQGSPSSSTMFFGITGTKDYMEFMANSQHNHHLVDPKKQSNQSEASYPDADFVITVSPNTLLDANRYVCDICHKGFPRKQNLVLHQRAHNLPFTLKTKKSKDPVPRKVYLCPEPTCVHHNRSHALGDFGGLRKHYLRKHCTQRNFKCDTCCKAYTVEADLKAHLKICGRKKYICHCGCCFSRNYNFTLHQEHCDAPELVGAAIYPQTLNIGDSSVKSTRNDNSSSHIGSIVSHSPTLGMGDDSIRFNRNENSYSYIGPQIFTTQKQSNSYHPIPYNQYQLSQFGEDHSSAMTNPSTRLNISNSHPTFISSSSTHLDQHECQMKTDINFYANLLTNKIPLDCVNPEDMSMVGDGGTSYRTGEGSSSLSNGIFMFDPSSSLNLTPAMHNTGQNGMLNPESGISDGRSYGHGSYYGYGYGSGHFDYGGGTEMHDFETSAATAQAVAPSESHFNQQGFWF